MSPGDKDARLPRAEARGSSPPEERARLTRSGRMMPLVKPPTIAPPIAMPDQVVESDDYDEIEVTGEVQAGEAPGKAKGR